MNPQDFQFVATTLKETSGVVLGKDKFYLLESRLAPLARREGFDSISELVENVRIRRDNRLITEMVDALTISDTNFFRDRTPFETLARNILPGLVAAKRDKKIRILSAGCSTGQEPYSLAMKLDQTGIDEDNPNIEIVAIDLSQALVDKAQEGLFSQFDIQRGLPIRTVMEYFRQQGDHWRINKSIRDTIEFKRQNILDPMESLGKFDVILCRNVLQYFEPPTRRNALTNLSRQLNEGGYLLLGSAETVSGLNDLYSPSHDYRGFYQVKRAAFQRAA